MAVDGRTKDRRPIEIGAVYTVAQFLDRTGMGRNGLRACERRGLRTVRSGGRKFIRGADWDGFLVEASKLTHAL